MIFQGRGLVVQQASRGLHDVPIPEPLQLQEEVDVIERHRELRLVHPSSLLIALLLAHQASARDGAALMRTRRSQRQLVFARCVGRAAADTKGTANTKYYAGMLDPAIRIR